MDKINSKLGILEEKISEFEDHRNHVKWNLEEKKLKQKWMAMGQIACRHNKTVIEVPKKWEGETFKKKKAFFFKPENINLMKVVKPQIQEVQWTPSTRNMMKTTTTAHKQMV